MATTGITEATENSSRAAKSLDAALWWEPFSVFLDELDDASVSSGIPPPQEKKLKDNHAWFLDTITRFRSPNQKSKEALDSPCIKIGLRELNVEPELKDAALKISPILSLDEVQPYILVKRLLERNNVTANDIHSDILNSINGFDLFHSHTLGFDKVRDSYFTGAP